MEPKFDLQQAVAEFRAAWEQGIHYPPAWHDRLSLEQAARLQLALLDSRCADGARQVGWKVGLTAKPIQEQFGVHEPVFGYLLDEGLLRSGAELATDTLLGPGFENEICFRLGAALEGPGVTPAHVVQAIDSLHPAMELIETRGDLSAQLAVAIADNVQQKAFVLGAPVPFDPALDLASVAVEVAINGEPVASGRGEAVLGNPLRSVAWLANRLAELGRALAPGEYIMAGSLTRQFPLHAGDHAVARFDPLGSVSLRLR